MHFRLNILALALVMSACVDIREQDSYVSRESFRFDKYPASKLVAQLCRRSGPDPEDRFRGELVGYGFGPGLWQLVGRTSNGQAVYEEQYALGTTDLIAILTTRVDPPPVSVFKPPRFLPVRPQDGWTKWRPADFATDDQEVGFRLLYRQDPIQLKPDPDRWRIRWRIWRREPIPNEQDSHITDLPSC